MPSCGEHGKCNQVGLRLWLWCGLGLGVGWVWVCLGAWPGVPRGVCVFGVAWDARGWVCVEGQTGHPTRAGVASPT